MQLNKNAKILVKAHVLSISQVIDKGGVSGRWPMPVLKTTNDASIFSEPILAENLYQRLTALKEKNFSIKQIAKIFPYPSTLARMTMIFRSRSVWNLNKKQQIDLMNTLADVLSAMYESNPFCYQGKNILLNLSQQKELFKLRKRKQGTVEKNLLAQLDGRLWMYTEMIFSRWHNLGHEFHGPYGKDEKLLVKEWHDLQGFGIAPFKNFPFKKIACYEFYKNNSVSIDIHNRTESKKPIIQTLTKAFVEVDGKLVDQKNIKDIIQILDQYLLKGSSFLATRNKKQLKQTNAMMEFYAIRPLADALGKNWKPPVSLIKQINSGKLSIKQRRMLDTLSKLYANLNNKNLRIQFDPTIEFN